MTNHPKMPHSDHARLNAIGAAKISQRLRGGNAPRGPPGCVVPARPPGKGFRASVARASMEFAQDYGDDFEWMRSGLIGRVFLASGHVAVSDVRQVHNLPE